MTQPTVIAGRYRVVRSAGRGGTGTVWLCRDETLHRDVAVKQVGALPGQDVRETARALREARLAAAVNHPNVVAVFDVVDDGGAPWLVMEYVPSRTLSQVIAAEGPLPPRQAGTIGAQVADALAAAHALGIVHRDVKPGNILVADDGLAKIGDFGIARRSQEQQLTQTGFVTGTPAFFAPELAAGCEPTPAADMWALGVTLYTAVEGKPPFEPRDNALAMLTAVVHDRIPEPKHAGGLTPILAGLLRRDPAERTPAKTAAAQLRDAADREPTKTTVVLPAPADGEGPVDPPYERPVAIAAPALVGGTATAPHAESPDRPRRGIRWWPAVAAAVAVLLLGAGGAVWQVLDQAAAPTTARRNTGAGAPDSAAGSPDTATATPRAGGVASGQPQPTSADTPAPTTAETGAANVPSAAAAEQFTTQYFDTVPDDLAAGWQMIAPSMHRDIGHGGYVAFWDSIASVTLGSVDALDPRTVRYEITYVRDDGTASTELKQLTLQANAGSYRITSDQPAD